MSIKEADRLGVMRQIDKRTLSIAKGAQELGLSVRQMKRIRKRYREFGEQGILSLHRGKISPNRTPNDVREKALLLVKENYSDHGPTLVSERLKERHGIVLSDETLRKWMIAEGLRRSKRRKERKIHQRRTRRSRFGEMIQGDGSHHLWFEDRGDPCCLIVFVDDATSKIPVARFFPTETTEAYSACLKQHLHRFGRPLSLYVDKHSVFRVNREELKKGIGITHFGRILRDLDIELICANSPQAKGRVERKNGVLQDRLVKDMRLANICSIEEANNFLPQWLEAHNKKFGKEAACSEDAHRPLRLQDKEERLFARRGRRRLSKDLSFQYQGVLYQIKTNTPNRMKHAFVDIFWKEGKPIEVEHNSKKLEYTTWRETSYEQPRIMNAKEIERNFKERKPVRPSMNHPWRGGRRIGL